jgi:phospholipase C
MVGLTDSVRLPGALRGRRKGIAVPIRAHTWRRIALAGTAATAAVTATVIGSSASSSATPPQAIPNHSSITASPIKHLVVLFDENVSFDHYFATYPNALDSDGTPFVTGRHTPAVNNLATAHLLKNNPNSYDPARLTPSQALTCDQNHGYTPEQKAEDAGAMDAFVQNVSVDTCSAPEYGAPGLTMDYYDGNTVTAMWNYAQNYAMSDNSWDSTFGPSTPGALNLISGQTHGVRAVTSVSHQPTTDSYVNPGNAGTVTNDPDPAFDDCSDANHTSTNNLAEMNGKNIGDLLNDRGVTWGWFQGGFAPTAAHDGTQVAVCGAKHTNIGGASVVDYSPHHNPFEYYASTANEHHLPPTSVDEIGHTGPAKHQYDITWFDKAVTTDHLPAVSFVKAAEYQDGHPGYSDPLDEQHFVVHTINELQDSPEWASTAVVIAYDDSDGWYDHVAPKIGNASNTALDAAICANSGAPTAGGYQNRCGPSQRLPLLLISPWSKRNFVSHTETQQSSITRFIEDNWSTGRIGDSSFDATAGSIGDMFSFRHFTNRRITLNDDGSVASVRPITGPHRGPHH